MAKPITLVNQQTGNLDLKVFTFESNCHFDHVQRLGYYSMIWVKRGSGTAKVDFTEYAFSANTMFFFTPYQPFMFEVGDDFEGTVINFHPDFFCIHKHHEQVSCNGLLFNNIYKPPFFLVDEQSEAEFDRLIEQLRTEMQNPSLAQGEILVSYLKIFLIAASRLKLEQQEEDDEAATINKEAPLVLKNLKDLIETHFKTKHSASDYAELLHITPKALGKATKTHFNRTLTDMISDRIIIEAKRDLYLTNKSVKEIAFDLGYFDEHHFSRFFKNKVDVSPKIYRDTVGSGRAMVNWKAISFGHWAKSKWKQIQTQISNSNLSFCLNPNLNY